MSDSSDPAAICPFCGATGLLSGGPCWQCGETMLSMKEFDQAIQAFLEHMAEKERNKPPGFDSADPDA